MTTTTGNVSMFFLSQWEVWLHSFVIEAQGARWPSGLERWTGKRVVRGSNPAEATSLRNFGNSVCNPALPVSFGGDTKSKSRRSLLSGVYARGSKRSHQSALQMCNLSYTPHSSLEKDNSLNHSCVSPKMDCLEYT